MGNGGHKGEKHLGNRALAIRVGTASKKKTAYPREEEPHSTEWGFKVKGKIT